MRVKSMTEGRPLRLIISIALPLMLGNIFQQLYTVVDASIVGNVLGVSALAALGAADWFNWLFLSAVQGIAQGFAIPMAQAFGAEDYPRLRKNIGNAAVLAVAVAAVITAAALLSVRPVLTLLGTPAEILPTSALYLTVLFAGLPVVMVYNLLAGILRSLGDARTPLSAMIIASMINIALDLLFVMVFHWGVAGAAIATVFAQFCSFLFCLYRLSRLEIVHLKRSDLRPEPAICAELMRIGVPLAAQNAIIAVGGMIVQSVVNGLGVVFIAGYTATNKLYGLLEIAATSFGYAMSTYTGQNLGAGKVDRIRRGVRVGAAAGVVVAGIIALCMFVFGKGIVSIFIDSTSEGAAEATRIACEFLWTMSACLPILYILHIYRSSLQGIGNTFMPMISGLAELVMRTGAAMLLPGMIGYFGVFIAEIAAWIGADFILLPSYFHDVKKIAKRLGSS